VAAAPESAEACDFREVATDSDPRNLHDATDEAGGARPSRSQRLKYPAPVRLVVARRVVTVSGTADERISTIAVAQEGRVSAAQLIQAGCTRHEITWRRRQGLLTPEHRGVYAWGHPGATQYSTEIAALLTRGPEALICAHRAAGMYGFRPMCEGVDLLVPDHQGGGHREGIRIHRSANSEHRAPNYVGGVPIVDPAWVLLEIAADLGERALEIALDEAFSTGRVSRDDVRRVVNANPTRAGAGTLKHLLAQQIVGNPTGSRGQERLLELVRAAGLPEPQMDAQIGGGFSADLFWRQQRVAAEYDSYTFHSSSRAWARDRRKSAYCDAQGIALVRVDTEDLDRGVLALVARLAGLIAARTPTGRG
jgi:hypothetical protein